MASILLEANIGQMEIYSGNSMGYSIFSIYDSCKSTGNCWWHSSISILGNRPTIGV